jgi:hypothetical protein
MDFSSRSGIAVEEHVPIAFPCNDRRACSLSVSYRPGEAIPIELWDRPPAAQCSRRAGRAAGQERRTDQAFRRGPAAPRRNQTMEEQVRFPQLATIGGLEFANRVIEAEIAGVAPLSETISATGSSVRHDQLSAILAAAKLFGRAVRSTAMRQYRRSHEPRPPPIPRSVRSWRSERSSGTARLVSLTATGRESSLRSLALL